MNWNWKRLISLAVTLVLLFSITGTATATEPEEKTEADDLIEALSGGVPTYQEAYESMIALKETYTEGMAWTNFTPYGSDGPLGDSYVWKGGSIYGANRGVGCAAFAFILSDAAFGNLPARVIERGSFTFEDVKVGDILRVRSNSHSVIVLQKSPGGVVVAEGNYNKSVHWGRVMNEEEVLNSSFIITRYPVGYVLPDDPDADKVAQEGQAGSLHWTLTNAGALTVSGNGVIPDYSAENLPPWYDCNVNTVIIEKGVTGIGDYAFYRNKALSIYIPDGIGKIGQNAFSGSSLISVTIPGTVEGIGDYAFHDCSNLTSVTVSEGVKTIGNDTFRGCTSLAYIDFPASITSVGAGAFMSCSEMKRVRFMPGTKTVTLGDGLFAQCWMLESVTLPQTADRISADMFSSCSSLPSLYIPESVTEIGENPFTSCRALKYIYFGGGEAAWKAMVTPALEASLKSTGTTVNYNTAFDDPFAPAPNDPGDLLPGEDEGGKEPDEGDNNPDEDDKNPDESGKNPDEGDNGNDKSDAEDKTDQNGSQTQTTKLIKVTKISITGLSNKIVQGKKITLKAAVSPSNATNKKVTWKSSNTKVATVDPNGVVTLKKKSGGKKVTITATAADGSKVTGSYKITSMKNPVKKISISGVKSVKAGKSIKLKAKVQASKGANKKVSWTSSNKKYAAVSASGKVKTYKAGKGKKVKITANATDGSGKKKTVTIKIK